MFACLVVNDRVSLFFVSFFIILLLLFRKANIIFFIYLFFAEIRCLRRRISTNFGYTMTFDLHTGKFYL